MAYPGLCHLNFPTQKKVLCFLLNPRKTTLLGLESLHQCVSYFSSLKQHRFRYSRLFLCSSMCLSGLALFPSSVSVFSGSFSTVLPAFSLEGKKVELGVPLDLPDLAGPGSLSSTVLCDFVGEDICVGVCGPS